MASGSRFTAVSRILECCKALNVSQNTALLLILMMMMGEYMKYHPYVVIALSRFLPFTSSSPTDITGYLYFRLRWFQRIRIMCGCISEHAINDFLKIETYELQKSFVKVQSGLVPVDDLVEWQLPTVAGQHRDAASLQSFQETERPKTSTTWHQAEC